MRFVAGILASAVAAAAWSLAAPPTDDRPPVDGASGPPERRPAEPPGEAAPGPHAEPATVHLAVPAEADDASLLLGGSTVAVAVTGRPGETVDWALAHRGTVLVRGRLVLDAAGRGGYTMEVPRVRHRSVCLLAAWAGAGVGEHHLTIHPASSLEIATGRLAELRLGVVDPRGRVQGTLAAQGVRVEDLAPQTARDFFRGGLVVLAGYDDAASLAFECRHLESRVRGGLGVLVLNPPAGWSGWGMRAVRLRGPPRAPASPAGPLEGAVTAADVGTGPWPGVLAIDDGIDVRRFLAADAAAPAVEADGRPADAILVAARPLGKGWVVVSVLPQTTRPDRDPVGRAVMDRLILWLAGRSAGGAGNELEERSDA